MQMIRNLLIASAIAVTPLAAASCQQIPPPEIEWSETTSTVPFTLFRGNRVVAPGKVNGKTVDFILDTGASLTVLDKSFARSIGLPEGQKIQASGAGGTQEAEVVPNVTLSIGGMTFTGMVAVIDFSPLAGQMGRPMDVVLGREFFDHAAVTLDWSKSELTITERGAFVPAADAREVKLARKGPFNYVDIEVAGLAPVTAVLDLGNGGALSLPEKYWSKQPKLTGLHYAESQAGGVGGLHSARATTIPTVKFAGVTLSSVPATLQGKVGEGAEDSPNIGIAVLRQFKTTLDLARDRLFLEPLPTPPGFIRDRSGVRAKLAGDNLTVSFVSPRSPAAFAGIKAGDKITSINGTAITPEFYTGSMADWSNRAIGQMVELSLADGRAVALKLADYY